MAAVPCSSEPSARRILETPAPPTPVKCQSAPGAPQQELQWREGVSNRDEPSTSVLRHPATAYAAIGHGFETAGPATDGGDAGSRMASEESMPAPPSEFQFGLLLDKATSMGQASVQLFGPPANVPLLKPPPVTSTARRRSTLASAQLSTDGCRIGLNAGRHPAYEAYHNHAATAFDERLHWWPPLHDFSVVPVPQGPQPTTPTAVFASRNHDENSLHPLGVPVQSSLPWKGGRRSSSTWAGHRTRSTTRLIRPRTFRRSGGIRRLGIPSTGAHSGWLFMLALTTAAVISFCASYTVANAFVPHQLRHAAAVNGEQLTVKPPPPEAEYQHSPSIGAHIKFHHHEPHLVDPLPGEDDRVELHVHHDVPTEIKSSNEKSP